MNLPVMCQSLYSVEQVEFVRRIRGSGLNREQVMAIWDRLDRIDAELLSPTNGLPFTSTASSTGGAASSGAATSSHPRDFLQLLHQERQQQASALMVMQMQQILSANSGNKPNPAQNSENAAASGGFGGSANSENDASAKQPLKESTADVGVKPEPGLPDAPQVPARLVDESDPELVEYLRNNSEPMICEQIRQFIALNGIKQHQVAVIVGTSQSYISKYLKADYLEMSERSRRNIYRWYVTYRNQPARAINDACAVIANPHLQHSVTSSVSSVPMTLSSSALPLPLYTIASQDHANSGPNNDNNASPGSPRSTSSSSVGNNSQPINNCSLQANSQNNFNWTAANRCYNTSTGTLSSHRRFRFTFRTHQLAILEKAFSEDTYPTVERREELARQLSQGLDGEHSVSLFTVTNWFANRRKEAKRAAVEEGLNVEELGMKRGRGRPSILHRMASAQMRETRQSFNGSVLQAPGDNSGRDSPQTAAKRPRKDEDVALTDDDDQCSMSSAAVDAPDDLSTSSGGGGGGGGNTDSTTKFTKQQQAELAVFPTPEVIAS